MVEPPKTESELLQRAQTLAGLTVGQLAQRLKTTLADQMLHGKGQIGELMELALGATAGNLDQPDFVHLGVELKTIPLDRAGRVRESTYVCALNLAQIEREEWETSRVKRKLNHVLWVPIEAGKMPTPARHIGTPRLWRPNPEQAALLRADWTELVGAIAIGGIEEITGHLGRVLQLRPKAKNASVLVEARGPEGEILPVVPRGFYLRTRFTEEILWAP